MTLLGRNKLESSEWRGRCCKLIVRFGIKNLQARRFLSRSLRWESVAEDMGLCRLSANHGCVYSTAFSTEADAYISLHSVFLSAGDDPLF